MPGLAAEVANLIVALKLDDSGFSGKMNRVAGQLRAMDRGLAQIGRGTGQVAGGIGRIANVAAVAAAGGLAAVVTTAASFEQAWAGVTKTVEGANEELKSDFEDLSRTIPLSFEELAAIGAEGGALGIATKDLINFTDIVARLAVSTDLSADQASSSLGQLANVLRLEDAALRDFGDSLVALGNDGASTESQILDMTARFGAAGHQAGLSSEAILALASTTASMGIEAEAGGGALSRIFNGITLDIATVTDESKIMADAMGLSLGELRTAWEQDAGKVFGELLEHINSLDQFEAAQFLSDLGITNTRDINAITLLATGVEEYNRQLEVSTGQTDELNRESQAFFDTTQGKWQIFKNNVRLAADTFGSELLPVINETMDDLVTWLNDPAVKTGMGEMAQNLAEGVRGLITAIKSQDFSSALSVLRGAADIAKAGFDAFRQLPPGVQSLALAAFGINRLTGGALSDIARGFGNIFAGGLKLALGRGETPLRPMFVQQVGLPGTGGGPTPVGGGGGFGRLLLGLTGVGLAAMLADEFEEEIDGLSQDIALAIGGGRPLIDVGGGPETWQWPFGSANPPSWLPEFLGGPRPDLSNPFGLTPEEGRAALAKFTAGSTKLLPGFSEARNVKGGGTLPDTAVLLSRNENIVATLPDTAMLPMVSEITKLKMDTVSADRSLLDQARSANAYHSRTAAASEATSRLKLNPTFNIHNAIQIPVSVNTSVVQNQIYTQEVIRRGVTPTGPTEIR